MERGINRLHNAPHPEPQHMCFPRSGSRLFHIFWTNPQKTHVVLPLDPTIYLGLSAGIRRPSSLTKLPTPSHLLGHLPLCTKQGSGQDAELG